MSHLETREISVQEPRREETLLAHEQAAAFLSELRLVAGRQTRSLPVVHDTIAELLVDSEARAARMAEIAAQDEARMAGLFKAARATVVDPEAMMAERVPVSDKIGALCASSEIASAGVATTILPVLPADA